MDFQPAGDDHDEDELEYLDFGDPVVTQKPRSPPKVPQYVPKFRGGFGLPEKKQQQMNGSVNEATDGNVISKRRQRKKRGAAQPPVTDAMAKDNFRIACTRGNEEELKTHLVNGFDANTLLKSDWTGLMYACDSGHEAIVKLLLSYGADPNYVKDKVTPLMVCCSSMAGEQSLVNIAKLLISSGASITIHDRYHMSPLLLASYKGKCSLVSELLTLDCDVNKQDSRGWSCLHYAAEVGNVKLARILLEAGIDTKLMSFTGETAMDIAYSKDFTKVGDMIDKVISGRQTTPPLETCDNVAEERSPVKKPVNTAAATNSSGGPLLIHYGDMELFLISIQLGNLMSLFQAKKVSFADLLVTSDAELQKIGVSDADARQRVLGAVLNVHKQEWKMLSHATLPHGRSLRFMEATLIASNLSKHVTYVASTADYLRGQLDSNPSILEQCNDQSDIHQDMLVATESIAKLQQHVEAIKAHTSLLSKQGKDETVTVTTRWQLLRPVAMTIVTSAGMALIGVAAVHYWTGRPWPNQLYPMTASQ